MTHEEYLERLESFGDATADVADVLSHAGSCTQCRSEKRAAEKALAQLEPYRRSLMEEIVRWSAAAAIVLLLVAGFRRELRETGQTWHAASRARYLIVGDASGVVAYTPEGIVVGTVAPKRTLIKEIER